MLPLLDEAWTWEAWAAAQRAADPWKRPHTRDEVGIEVRRGREAGFGWREMGCMLQVPDGEILALWHERGAHDPIRSEITRLAVLLRALKPSAAQMGKPFPEEDNPFFLQLVALVGSTQARLNGLTEVADPATVAKMLRRGSLRRTDDRVVRSYFDEVRAPSNTAPPLPVLDPGEQGSPAETRRRMQAVSSVLADLGLTCLPAYPPRAKGAIRGLRALLIAELNADPALAASLERAAVLAATFLPAPTKTFAPPPERSGPTGCAGRRRGGAPWDRSAADARNGALGDAGEEFVIAVERRRLRREGRSDLAHLVEWTARDVGEGEGYDVASFNADRTPRLIEVKTTNGAADTPFFLTANEVRVSADRHGDYWLYRVFDFGQRTRAIYTLRGALDGGELTLTPTFFRAAR